MQTTIEKQSAGLSGGSSDSQASKLINRLKRYIVRNWLAFRYRILSRRGEGMVIERLDGLTLLILPGVFNPVLLRSGEFLASVLRPMTLEDATRVLDMGTGSGIGAIVAAQKSALVTAVDINPEAVRCTRINALVNRVENRITVIEGDLFSAIGGEKYDLVLFNPPFYRGVAADAADYAWRGETVFDRFAANLAAALEPGGRAVVVLSSDGDGEELLQQLQDKNYSVKPVKSRDYVNEILTAYEVEASEQPKNL